MIELQRKQLWLSSYHDTMEEIRRTPFSWGRHDCVTGLATRVILAITGVDLAAELRDFHYGDARSALLTLRAAGVQTVGDLAASYLPEYGHSSEAHLADIAAIPTDNEFGHVLGVFNGERIAVLTPEGMGWAARRQVTRAFRVGRV